MIKLVNIIDKPLSGEWGDEDKNGLGIPVLRTTNFTNTGNINYTNVTTRIINDEKAKKKYLRYGDILIEKSGGSPTQPVGRVVFFEGENNKYLFNNFTSRLRLNDETECPKYIFYALYNGYKIGKTQRFQNKTTGIINLQLERFIRETEIPLPPLEVQQKIADTLDTVSDLLKMRKEQLAELDHLIQSVFYDMFGDPITNEKGWGVVSFQNVLVLQRGFDLPTHQRNLNGHIDVYGSNGVLGKHDIYKITGGGVITGRSGTIGKVHYTLKNYWPLNTTLFSKDLKGNNIIFLAYLLKNFKIERFSTGTGVPTLNRNIIHSENIYDIPLPLQQKFANIVTQVEAQKVDVQKAIDETQILFDALMQDYFE